MVARSLWSASGAQCASGALVGLALVVAVGLAGYQGLSSLMRNQKEVRYMINPLNSVYALGRAGGASRLPREVRALKPVGEDAQLGASYAAQARGALLMLVVGETARAQNWQLNGYPRPTTPRLAQWQTQGDLVNFSDVSSCGTNTQVSVPCMFSPLTRDQGGDQPARRKRTCSMCCSAPAWRCCGSTTSRVAKVFATACPMWTPAPCSCPVCVAMANAPTRSCSTGWMPASKRWTRCAAPKAWCW